MGAKRKVNEKEKEKNVKILIRFRMIFIWYLVCLLFSSHQVGLDFFMV